MRFFKKRTDDIIFSDPECKNSFFAGAQGLPALRTLRHRSSIIFLQEECGIFQGTGFFSEKPGS
ncbi:MAG: hypothetical protein BWK80_09985 [Desulfobacteraceae bacterium IS3]|nr:MAG: hypothetical protein BWK80_09985 [Desulfobacteraceae bacterium IS3]